MKNKCVCIYAVLCCTVLVAESFVKSSSNLEEPSGSLVSHDESATNALEEELFGSDDSMVLTPEEINEGNTPAVLKAELKTASLVLNAKKIRMGGSIDSSLALVYKWNDLYRKNANTMPAVGIMNALLGATIFFDARPIENLKLYGKIWFGVPVEKQLVGLLNMPAVGKTVPVLVSGSPNVKIKELYTDFSAWDIAFFRFGKHVVKWGTGYFYSPADMINISQIDPQHPEKERDGAVSLRTRIIIPNTQHTVLLYVLPDMQHKKPEFTAAAAKADFLAGNWEIGIGGWYRYQKAPRFITTLSGSIAGKVGVFGEGVCAWGSDYTYYKADNTLSSYSVKNYPFFQGTIGCAYTSAHNHISCACQYLYNGFGYTNPLEIQKAASAKMSKKNIVSDTHVLDVLSHIAAFGNTPGQHYVALHVSHNKIGTDNVRLTLFQEFALSELEGRSVLTLHWDVYQFVSVKTGFNVQYPLAPQSLAKGNVGFSVSMRLGGGKF